MEVICLTSEMEDIFWQLRAQLLGELGEMPQGPDAARLEQATREYYRAHVNRDLFSWAVQEHGHFTAIGSLCLFQRVPYQGNLTGLEGYIFNVYTCPACRKRGYAARVLDAIAAFAQERGIGRLWLHSSDGGKRIYTAKGFSFRPDEMERFLLE